MSFFGKLVKGVLDTALLPVDVAADMLTGCGIATDQKKPYTLKRIEKVIEDVEQAGEDAGNGNWITDGN